MSTRFLGRFRAPFLEIYSGKGACFFMKTPTPETRAEARRTYMRRYMKAWRAAHKDRVLMHRIAQARRLLQRYGAESSEGGAGE